MHWSLQLREPANVLHKRIVAALFFASGFAGLVYQVLWLRQLSLLFGSTAMAAATTLAVFFAGLSLGSYLWGRYAARARRPLRAYAVLEIGVAVSALSYFVLLDLYHAVYPWLFARLSEQPSAFVGVKFLLAAGLLLPSTVFMGGTLPLIGQHLIRRAADLGPTGSALYAINTLGGAGGAITAGFLLPAAIGFSGTYTVAIAVTLAVAVLALSLDRGESPPHHAAAVADADDGGEGAFAYGLAFASGALTLAMEVLWTRMLAQVLHNSVYSFSAVLVTFLVSLAAGAFLAGVLARRVGADASGKNSLVVLATLLALAGTATGTAPFLFHWFTGGLAYTGGTSGFAGYVASVFGLAFVVTLVPVTLAGAVLPYLFKLRERAGLAPGALIGRLIAANTAGAIAGSLVAGFVALPALGLWTSIRAVALTYLVLALWAASRDSLQGAHTWIPRVTAAIAVLALTTVADPADLPIVRSNPDSSKPILWVAEGPHGTVAVVGDDEYRAIKLNNYYTVGGNGAAANDRRQATLPLLLHPAPRSAFFLGMGTGITASGALRHPLERIDVCEIVPEIIEASRRFFHDDVQGLFEDPRVRVITDDGKHYLRGTSEHYDVVVSDLFTPWRAGAGSLYTVEHYRAVRRRLSANGVFAQWLPLYQLSRGDFLVIARTMVEAFPLVTLWRGDFNGDFPVVALMGHASNVPLDRRALVRNLRAMPLSAETPEEVAEALTLIFYVANVTAAQSVLSASAVNSDAWPVVEYNAPVVQRQVRAGRAHWLTGSDLIALFEELGKAAELAADPYLARLDHEARRYVAAGLDLHAAFVYQERGRVADAKPRVDAFRDAVPYAVYLMMNRQLNERGRNS